MKLHVTDIFPDYSFLTLDICIYIFFFSSKVRFFLKKLQGPYLINTEHACLRVKLPTRIRMTF